MSTSPRAPKIGTLIPPIAGTSAKRSKNAQQTPSMKPQTNHASAQELQVITSSAFKSRNRRATIESNEKREVLAAQSQKKRKQLNMFYEKIERISPVLSSYPSQKKESSQKAMTGGFNDQHEHLIGESGISIAAGAIGEEEADMDDEERQQLIMMTHTFEDIL